MQLFRINFSLVGGFISGHVVSWKRLVKSRVGPLKSPVKISRIPASGVVNRATEKSINQLIKHSRTSEAQQVGELSIFPSSCALLLLFAARLETRSNALSPVGKAASVLSSSLTARTFPTENIQVSRVFPHTQVVAQSYSPADNLHDPMMRA